MPDANDSDTLNEELAPAAAPSPSFFRNFIKRSKPRDSVSSNGAPEAAMPSSTARKVALERDLAEEQQIRDNAAAQLMSAPAAGAAAPEGAASRASRYLIIAMSGFGGIEYSVVLPSLWAYVQQAVRIDAAAATGSDGAAAAAGDHNRQVTVMLLAQAYFTFASMWSKPIIGSLSDLVGFRPLFGLCSFFGALGGLCYALARDVLGGVDALLLARLLGGIAGAQSTLGNAYVVRVLPEGGMRQQQLAMIAAATLLGTFVGPAVVPLFAAFQPVTLTLLGTSTSVTVDELTLPGLFLFAAFGLALVLQPYLMVEPPSAEELQPPWATTPRPNNGTNGAARSPGDAANAYDASSPNATASPDVGADGTVATPLPPPPPSSPPPSPPRIPPPGGRWLSLLLSYASTFVFAVTLFSTVPVMPLVTEAHFGWGPVPNAYLFLCLAAFTLVGVLSTGAFLKAGGSPFRVQLFAVLLLLAHELLLVTLTTRTVFASPWRFVVWAGVCAASYAGFSGSNAAIVTSVVDSRSAGFAIGVLGFVDTAGSSAGPLYLRLFGVDSGVSTDDALAASRMATAWPTALLLAGHAARVGMQCKQWSDSAERRGGRAGLGLM